MIAILVPIRVNMCTDHSESSYPYSPGMQSPTHGSHMLTVIFLDTRSLHHLPKNACTDDNTLNRGSSRLSVTCRFREA
jgi:hypothetical protein